MCSSWGRIFQAKFGCFPTISKAKSALVDKTQYLNPTLIEAEATRVVCFLQQKNSVFKFTVGGGLEKILPWLWQESTSVPSSSGIPRASWRLLKLGVQQWNWLKITFFFSCLKWKYFKENIFLIYLNPQKYKCTSQNIKIKKYINIFFKKYNFGVKKICKGGVLVPQCREEQGGEVGTAQSTNWRNGRDLDPGLTPLKENSQGPSAAFSPLDVLSLGQKRQLEWIKGPELSVPSTPCSLPKKGGSGARPWPWPCHCCSSSSPTSPVQVSPWPGNRSHHPQLPVLVTISEFSLNNWNFPLRSWLCPSPSYLGRLSKAPLSLFLCWGSCSPGQIPSNEAKCRS